ncbi:DUF6484 domain-containing protein [Sorangium sp. So ce1182]|uniref:DUF6484 domain-containing protein n=1 Tax=Sorangium sp. So ce1182 TaxID=3133334 RepID=UPI003F61F31F
MTRSARAVQAIGSNPKKDRPKLPSAADRVRGPTAGSLASVRPDGSVLVRWSGQNEPVAAAIAAHLPRQALLDAILARADVLLDFLDGDIGRPVILGLLRHRIDITDERRASFDLDDFTLHAPKNLVLECGESSISLTHTGRITIRGTEIVSESTGAVKLKGAHVELN